MSNDFMSCVKKTLEVSNPNVSVTENGAVGYRTTNKPLLDMNFQLSSMRNMSDDHIWTFFLNAYNENPVLAVVWLFFARDVRGGCGERRVFRVIMPRLAYENPDMVVSVLELIPKYGRWDDLLELICGNVPCKVRDAAFAIFKKQISDDIYHANYGEPVSVLAKWVYSNVTSSKETRRKAEILRSMLGWAPKQYRHNLTSLRRIINVTEQKMSANKWDEIDYDSVPSKAGMIYRGAFARHDADRYAKYLEDVKNGSASMKADVLFPYEIVHSYTKDAGWWRPTINYDETLELKWKNLPNVVKDNGSTLVVVDGSGSMGSNISNTTVTRHDVARSLAIYFSERLTGQFRNTFITFSSNPQFVSFDENLSLKSKIEILMEKDECSDTNIERTFDLLLAAAVQNHMKQDEIPANILVISDMEFNSCASGVTVGLFDHIFAKWEEAGYKMPRLVFWNVCSRTGTIPVIENEAGVALVSGFSPMIADMVMSGELDPYQNLVNKLSSPRYEDVWKAVSGV